MLVVWDHTLAAGTGGAPPPRGASQGGPKPVLGAEGAAWCRALMGCCQDDAPDVAEELAPEGHAVMVFRGSPAGEGLYLPTPLPATQAFLLQNHSHA